MSVNICNRAKPFVSQLRYVFFVMIALILMLISSTWMSASAQTFVCYEYDALGRLVEVNYDAADQISYSYDSAGNRTSVDVDIGGGVLGCDGASPPPPPPPPSGSSNLVVVPSGGGFAVIVISQ